MRYPLDMNGLFTYADMNIFPLGSYDILIGMDWLEMHRGKLDYYNKTFECLNEEGKLRVVRGIPKVISIRQASTMQLKKLCGKGDRLYATHVLEVEESETPRLEDFHVLQEFKDAFLDEIPRLPPKRDIDSTIELMPGASQVYKKPYMMST